MSAQKTFNIPYGQSVQEIKIPAKNVLRKLELSFLPPLNDLKNELINSFNNPISCPSLNKIIKDKLPTISKLIIIVSDNTRACPYPKILPVLTKYLEDCGITREKIKFLIACGTHRDMNDNEIEKHYGKETYENFQFFNHDCRAKDLCYIGDLPSGGQLRVNKLVKEADFIITTGILNTHYMAGFSGGRKSILPGVSDYETIRRNHSMVQDSRVSLAKLENNPIHIDMKKAAELANIDFNLNFVLNKDKQVSSIFSGDIEESFLEGSKFIAENYSVPYSQLADVVITSSGGFPKDRTLYHSQKCLNNVIDLVKKNGTIVVFSECQEGIGSSYMEEYMSNSKNYQELLHLSPEKIEVGGHRAVASAKLLDKAEIIFFTTISREIIENMLFSYYNNWEKILKYLNKKHGSDFKAYIILDGAMFNGIQQN